MCCSCLAYEGFLTGSGFPLASVEPTLPQQPEWALLQTQFMSHYFPAKDNPPGFPLHLEQTSNTLLKPPSSPLNCSDSFQPHFTLLSSLLMHDGFSSGLWTCPSYSFLKAFAWNSAKMIPMPGTICTCLFLLILQVLDQTSLPWESLPWWISVH